MHKYPLSIQELALIAATQATGLVCWNMIPRLAPLLMDNVGATPAVISWITGTIPQLITLLLTPIISIWSDNHHSSWGRRRPFLWWTAPIFCLTLLSIPFASKNVIMLSCALTMFAICAHIPATLVYYLIPETIPFHHIGRFTAWNGALSSLCAAIYNYCCLGWCKEHELLAIMIAITIYTIAMFTLLVIPQEEAIKKTQKETERFLPKIWRIGSECAKECMGEPKYLFIFLCMGFNQASMILRTILGILFATKEIGMTVDQFGRVSGICAALGAISAILLGRRIDKTSPLVFYQNGSLFVMVISLIGFFFVHSPTSYAIIAILTTICYSVQSIAYTPLLVSFFPKEKYGQFSSVNTILCTLMVMTGSAIGGWLTQYTGLRFILMWDFIMTTIGTLFLFKLKKYAAESSFRK